MCPVDELCASYNLSFSWLLGRVAWWLDTDVSGDRVASIFRVEVHGESESESLSVRPGVEPLFGLMTTF
jgi:hypothetical protein